MEIDAGNVVIFNLPLGAIGEKISATFGKFVLASLQAIARRWQPVPERLAVPTVCSRTSANPLPHRYSAAEYRNLVARYRQDCAAKPAEE